MEKLIKSALGQWRLVKAWVKDENQSTSVNKLRAIMPSLAHGFYGADTKQANREHLDNLFSNLNGANASENGDEAKKQKGAIREFVLKAPKGTIDIGHLNHLDQSQTNRDSVPHSQRIHAGDMSEMVGAHTKDNKSLKEVHDQHGDGGVEAVLRAHGTNGSSRSYANKHLNPFLHHEANHAVRGHAYTTGPAGDDKGELVDEATADHEVSRPDAVKHLSNVPKYDLFNNPHNDEVDKTFHRMMKRSSVDETNPNTNKRYSQEHEDAVIRRGLDAFKTHHKLKKSREEVENLLGAILKPSQEPLKKSKWPKLKKFGRDTYK